jgi:hypothetical protein
MLEDALGKSGAKGAKTRIIMVGRVGIWFTSFDGSVTSVPYPFFLNMAKVQLRGSLAKRDFGVFDNRQGRMQAS